jgi:hypothetical protein
MDEPASVLQRSLAVAIGSAVVGCVVTGAVCAVLLDFSASETMSSFLATNAMMGLTFGLCGALIAWHRPHNPVGWLLTADGLGHALSAAAGPAAALAHEQGAPVTVQRLLVTVFAYSWPWSIALFLPLTLLLFPDGRPFTRRWRLVVVAAVVSAPLFVVETGAGLETPLEGLPVGYLTLPSYDRLSWLWVVA